MWIELYETLKIHFFLKQKDCAILNVQYFLCFAKVCEMGGYQVKAYREVNS